MCNYELDEQKLTDILLDLDKDEVYEYAFKYLKIKEQAKLRKLKYYERKKIADEKNKY